MLEEIFEDIGNISYKRALHGEQALSVVKEHCIENAGRFDFILLDISMPVMDGFECANELRRMEENREVDFSNTTLIALSATTQDHFQGEEGSKYFDSFFPKPIQRAKLE